MGFWEIEFENADKGKQPLRYYVDAVSQSVAEKKALDHSGAQDGTITTVSELSEADWIDQPWFVDEGHIIRADGQVSWYGGMPNITAGKGQAISYWEVEVDNGPKDPLRYYVEAATVGEAEKKAFNHSGKEDATLVCGSELSEEEWADKPWVVNEGHIILASGETYWCGARDYPLMGKG